MRSLLVVGLLALLVPGCATHGDLSLARERHFRGDTEAAYASLDPGTLRRGDRMLGWLDRGLFAHLTGRFAASRDAFAHAIELVEELERIRISEQTGALVVNDRLVAYRGEHSERLWIHAFQIMNFLHLGAPDSAAVEARRALVVLDEHDEALGVAHFTRALVAHAFERIGQYASAAIEYGRIADGDGLHGAAAAHAANIATRAGRPDDRRRFAALADGATFDDTDAAMVLFVFDGRIAAKHAGDLFLGPTTRIAFPFYPPRNRSAMSIAADLDGRPVELASIATDTTRLSRDSLAARGRSIATRQTARAIGKHALGDVAAERNEVLGALVRTLLLLIEQADTRSWETLPATLALVRVPIPETDRPMNLSIDGRRVIPPLDLTRHHPGAIAYRQVIEGITDDTTRADRLPGPLVRRREPVTHQ